MDYNHSENFILGLIEEDEWMMDILQVAKSFSLPDWWVAAGFVRNKAWDHLHGFKKRTYGGGMDVDVIYFDPKDLSETAEKEMELKFYIAKPGIPWSVKNQARMHVQNGDGPYKDSVDAMAKWPETATCVGVKIGNDGKLVLAAPLGVSDVVNMVLRPNQNCKRNPQAFISRMEKKNWLNKWPKTIIIDKN